METPRIPRPLAPRSTLAACALAALALAPRPAWAQHHHHHHGPRHPHNETPPPPPPSDTSTATPTATNTPPPDTTTATQAAPPPSHPHHGASHPSEPPPPPPPRAPTPSEQVLVSGTINRPGLHAARAEFEIFAGVGPGAWAWPWGGFVVSPGMRFGVPLTTNGFLANLNNDVRLMVGAQWYASITPIPYWWIDAPVTLQWNFYLSNQWSVALEAGLAVDVFIYDLINCYDHPQLYCDRVFFHPVGGIGLRRHFAGATSPGFPAMTFRFMYPAGVQVALSF